MRVSPAKIVNMAQLSTNSRLEEIYKEVRKLRSFLIGIAGKDKEGNYNPNFVKRILKANKPKADYVYKDNESFLNHLRV